MVSVHQGGFPSGQRGQTVNLLAKPSEVRILPPPFAAVDVPWGQIATQAGVAQLARASAFQAEGRGFESRFPLSRRSRNGHQALQHKSLGPRSSVR